MLLKRSRTNNHTESFTQWFCLLPTLFGEFFFYCSTQWLTKRNHISIHYASSSLPPHRPSCRGVFGPGWPVIRGLGRALASGSKISKLVSSSCFFVCSWQFLAFSIWLLLAQLPVSSCWTEGLSNHLFLLTFPNTVCGLFIRWIMEINPKGWETFHSGKPVIDQQNWSRVFFFFGLSHFFLFHFWLVCIIWPIKILVVVWQNQKHSTLSIIFVFEDKRTHDR